MTYTEIVDDLFTAPDNAVLAHCISQDLKMGAGIAAAIVSRYGPGIRSEILKNAERRIIPDNPKLMKRMIMVGDTIRTPQKDYVVYNLITKGQYFDKPTYESLRLTLIGLRNQMADHGETLLAIPRIAAGIDRLSWRVVQKELYDVFEDTTVNIQMYYRPTDFYMP